MNVFRVCVVGSGPAGFYVTQRITKLLPSATVDIIEKLPVPFGLVRFGVAPDHPEVKNVINTFTKVAQNKNVNFYGNISLGKDVMFKQLKNNYHAVVLAYGAEEDKVLGIPNENIENVLSARSFVGWYNGSPYHQDLKIDLSGSSAVILGQGNVAMDVARILLTPIDLLSKTDITEKSLALLSDSKIKDVYLVGRRGPLQAAFTIKELRELLTLSNCKTVWRISDFEGIDKIVNDLPRPRKRMTDLMLKNLASSDLSNGSHNLFPIFCRSPQEIFTNENGKLNALRLSVNELMGEDVLTQICRETKQTEQLDCDLILRSIGYRSVRADPDLNFDSKRGLIKNYNGRVISNDKNTGFKMDEYLIEPGLYVTGWLRTGPVGVILTTMSNAFEIGSIVCNDSYHKANILGMNVRKDGFNGIKEILEKRNVQIVTWENWEKIDQYEIECGQKAGKPREKICDVKKMLEICS